MEGEGGGEGGRLAHDVCDGEDVDGDDHNPSDDTVVGMNAIGGVEHAHENHACKDEDSSIESGRATTPFVDEHEGYNGGDANEYGGNAGCKESCFRGGDAGLLEQEGSILDVVSGLQELWAMVFRNSRHLHIGLRQSRSSAAWIS
jgi:hypothetical protein